MHSDINITHSKLVDVHKLLVERMRDFMRSEEEEQCFNTILLSALMYNSLLTLASSFKMLMPFLRIVLWDQ